MNCEKHLKKHLVEISFSVFEGAPFKHFKHTKTFSRKIFLIFFSTFLENAFGTNSRFVSQKCASNKKGRNFGPRGLQIAAFQQSFSQCWWKRPILEGSLIQKPI